MSDDEIIRLQVRIAQLEGVIRQLVEACDDQSTSTMAVFDMVNTVARASLPTPPSPPTEAHAMRELQVADDDTA